MNITERDGPAHTYALALPPADDPGQNTGAFEILNHPLVLVLINPIVIFHQTSSAEAGTFPLIYDNRATLPRLRQQDQSSYAVHLTLFGGEA